MGANLHTHHANSIYDQHAGYYDRVLTGLVLPRVRKAIRLLDIKPGAKVLEVGIGTGASVGFFPDHCTVYGIDLSGGMLGKAAERVADGGHGNYRLVRCNALQPPFADGTFDVIFMSHVVSVVQDPAELIRVVRRLGKPGCRMVLINHFLSSNPLVAMMERFLNPLCLKLGWRSDLSLEELVEHGGLHVEFRYKLFFWDVWETVFATNIEAPRTSRRLVCHQAGVPVEIPPAPRPALPAQPVPTVRPAVIREPDTTPDTLGDVVPA